MTLSPQSHTSLTKENIITGSTTITAIGKVAQKVAKHLLKNIDAKGPLDLIPRSHCLTLKKWEIWTLHKAHYYWACLIFHVLSVLSLGTLTFLEFVSFHIVMLHKFRTHLKFDGSNVFPRIKPNTFENLHVFRC